MTNRIYLAYLLRLWREHPDSPWQAMLENPRTGERLMFATLKELTRFLADKTAGLSHSLSDTTAAEQETQ